MVNEHSFDRQMFKVERNGAIVALTMSRSPVNAINREWIAGFADVLDGIERDGGISVLLLRSSQRAFSAGADLKLMRECFSGEGGPDEMVETVRRMQALYDRVEALPLVTIAEIGGAAYGGGFELALACDLRIAAETAPLGLPETRLGLLPGAGGTQRLSRLAGPGIARRMILTAESVTGTEARALGLVQWAVPAAELAAFAESVAQRVAALSSKALAACKRCFGAIDARLDTGLLVERLETLRLLNTPDTRSRVAAFLDR
jgi:enoyl-CoA hydratase/carnithine racemase